MGFARKRGNLFSFLVLYTKRKFCGRKVEFLSRISSIANEVFDLKCREKERERRNKIGYFVDECGTGANCVQFFFLLVEVEFTLFFVTTPSS